MRWKLSMSTFVSVEYDNVWIYYSVYIEDVFMYIEGNICMTYQKLKLFQKQEIWKLMGFASPKSLWQIIAVQIISLGYFEKQSWHKLAVRFYPLEIYM